MNKLIALPVAGALFVAGCAAESSSAAADGETIVVSGSATVEPITRHIAQRTGYTVDITADGSTDGFDAFCTGDSDINNSSVAIPGAGEDTDFQAMCADNGVEYIELPIALDAITIVKNDANDWATDLSMEQLREIWSADSSVTQWADINPAWPAENITLVGRPEGSGTLGVFDEIALGGQTMRDDYAATDDINELSEWIAEDVNAIGFMGVGNYLATAGPIRDRIDNVLIDSIAPTAEQTQSGAYPISRPLFIYVNVNSLNGSGANVEGFVTEYLNRVESVVPREYFYTLPEQEYDAARQRFEDRVTGPEERWRA
ncbi:substrate-binding domain-containing protein [Corynebacterium sp. LK2510]|uniref:substrate-binding domain-containing protein n=1 Tax=Corynebacterium sp. LK2510 TaxID=3110472 RepID=UPI0034CFB4D0